MESTIGDAEEEQTAETDPFEMSDERLEEFVNNNIEVMRKSLSNFEVPNDSQLRRLCIQYVPVRLALQKLYSKVKFEALKAQSEFETFKADAYMVTREKYNKQVMDSGQKVDKKLILSIKEVEFMARVAYRDAFAEYEAKAALAECRRSFVERLTETWASYQFILGNLVKMYVSEVQATRVDTYAAEGLESPYDR